MSDGNKVGDAFVDIGLNTKPLENGFQQAGSIVNTGSNSLASKLMKGLALVGMGRGLWEFGKKAVSEFSKAEDASIDFEFAMAQIGMTSQATRESMRGLADEIGRTTKMDDEGALALISKLAVMGVASGKVKQYTEASMGLARMYGIGAEEAAKFFAILESGKMPRLRQAGIIGMDDLKPAQALSLLLERGAVGFSQINKEADTFSTKSAVMNTAVGNMMEKLGESKTVKDMLSGFTIMADLASRQLDKVAEATQEEEKRRARIWELEQKINAGGMSKRDARDAQAEINYLRTQGDEKARLATEKAANLQEKEKERIAEMAEANMWAGKMAVEAGEEELRLAVEAANAAIIKTDADEKALEIAKQSRGQIASGFDSFQRASQERQLNLSSGADSNDIAAKLLNPLTGKPVGTVADQALAKVASVLEKQNKLVEEQKKLTDAVNGLVTTIEGGA